MGRRPPPPSTTSQSTPTANENSAAINGHGVNGDMKGPPRVFVPSTPCANPSLTVPRQPRPFPYPACAATNARPPYRPHLRHCAACERRIRLECLRGSSAAEADGALADPRRPHKRNSAPHAARRGAPANPRAVVCVRLAVRWRGRVSVRPPLWGHVKDLLHPEHIARLHERRRRGHVITRIRRDPPHAARGVLSSDADLLEAPSSPLVRGAVQTKAESGRGLGLAPGPALAKRPPSVARWRCKDVRTECGTWPFPRNRRSRAAAASAAAQTRRLRASVSVSVSVPVLGSAAVLRSRTCRAQDENYLLSSIESGLQCGQRLMHAFEPLLVSVKPARGYCQYRNLTTQVGDAGLQLRDIRTDRAGDDKTQIAYRELRATGAYKWTYWVRNTNCGAKSAFWKGAREFGSQGICGDAERLQYGYGNWGCEITAASADSGTVLLQVSQNRVRNSTPEGRAVFEAVTVGKSGTIAAHSSNPKRDCEGVYGLLAQSADGFTENDSRKASFEAQNSKTGK
ncbi:hypothetical protein B0H17DRAFT_1139446 [Mycena rosella]|uniref:Uncharacterized protein n=1 Tax=Mycena rosella TaxID=1033263 RepID=A0AAD7D460_MYCRO|nr:hypothetical protein B0H17DRAFT_1139446 [Mycena rosella]